MNHHEKLESAVLYAAGILDPEDALRIEQEARLDRELAAELAGLSETAARLAVAAAVRPPPELRTRVAAVTKDSLSWSAEEPGIVVHRATQDEWTASPFPGVHYKRIAFDPSSDVASFLIRMDAGAEYPAHAHRTEEQCYVIQGEVWLGSVRLGTGDFSRAAAGTRHGLVRTSTGCLLFIVACVHDEILN